MTPLLTFWYSCALASSAGPVNGFTVAVGYRPNAPLRVPPSVLTPRPPSSADPSQTKLSYCAHAEPFANRLATAMAISLILMCVPLSQRRKNWP